MVFSSGVFLILFLPLVLLVYFNPLVKSLRFKNCWLLLASLFFYAWGEPDFVFVMLALIAANWLLALGVGGVPFRTGPRTKRVLTLLAVLLDVGTLFVFKYLSFAVDNLERLLGTPVQVPRLSLPIGISFFTFQILSYVLDVYYCRAAPAKNPLHTALYVSMFPQLVAGPIVRYSTVSAEIQSRRVSRDDFAAGVRKFTRGLAKKILLADILAEIADEIFLTAGVLGGLTVLSAWIGALAYTFQIYFDFSGYSDMAIGLGRLFGFHFEENFDRPYAARSVSEFWKRWHISLTSWFRDYVYIPLGGSRCSKGRHTLNLFLVWLLTGVWHGANWTFILWGLIYFVLQYAEKAAPKRRLTGWAGWAYTFFCVTLCWVIFRSNSVGDAFVYIGKMFGRSAELFDEISLSFLRGAWKLLLAAALCCVPRERFQAAGRIPAAAREAARQAGTVLLFLASILTAINGNYSPFIYFNF